MTTENSGDRPKYACDQCGNVEVRGDFDTYQVYLAEGDRLIHIRSEATDPGILALYCNACDAEIWLEDLDEIEII